MDSQDGGHNKSQDHDHEVLRMKAIQIKQWVKSYDELGVSDLVAPIPKAGELVVDVKAAGVNFVDLLYVSASFSAKPQSRGKHQNNKSLVTPPFILGLEFAGIVSHAPQSSKFPVGSRVYGSHQGSYAEQICVPEKAVNLVPESWTYGDAAGLAATAPVSYGALIARADLKKGETVLIHAAAGGLGLMAVQIAKAVGATVIATAGSEEKRAVAKSFGADMAFDYGKEGWWKEVLEATNGRGVDVVYDPVGKISESLKCCAPFARLLLIGFAGTEGNIEKIGMNRILLRQVQIIGYRFGDSARKYPQEAEDLLEACSQMIKEGRIQPTVYNQSYVGLESVPTALYDLAARKIWGKAVITIDREAGKARL